MCAKAGARHPILIRRNQIDAGRGFFLPTLLLLVVAEAWCSICFHHRTNLIGWVAAKLRFSISEAIKQVDLLNLVNSPCKFPVQRVAISHQLITLPPACFTGLRTQE